LVFPRDSSISNDGFSQLSKSRRQDTADGTENLLVNEAIPANNIDAFQLF